MKKIIAAFLAMSIGLLYCGNSLAETIHLKDGSITKGEITKSSKDSITVKTKFGDMTIPKSDIERVEYDKEWVKKKTKIQPVEKESMQKYERDKLGIRTVDVYRGYSSSFGSASYSKFLNMAFGSSVSATSLTPTQKWIITRGKFDITHLEFLKIIEPQRAITVEQRINELIQSKEEAYAGCWVAAIAGCIAMIVGAFPLEQKTIHFTYSGDYTYMTYGTLNWVLLIGGGVLMGVGVGIGTSLESEIPALKQMPNDPMAHFDSLEHTQKEIDEHNKNLRVKLGINF